VYLSPKSIALIGASGTPGKLGYDILSNLRYLGYMGKIFPINPKGGFLLGIQAYPDISSLPQIPDVVLIAIPAIFVNEAAEQCGKKGVKNLVIISAGFKEVGDKGLNREKELQKIVKKYNMCLIGPNCLGIINTELGMNASFAEGMPSVGGASLVSQSGAMAVAMIDWAYESGLGFQKIISMGNKAGVTENDFLEYLGSDPKTKVILMYLESIDNGSDFMRIAKKVSQKKPIIIIKSGTSQAGTHAISSHTGSLAGSDAAVSTAFSQSGIIRADTVEELFDLAKAFSSQNPPAGNRVGIITNAGGPGIMATDAIDHTSLVMPELTDATQERLAAGLPKTAALHNPVDVIGDALSDRYQHAIRVVLESDEVDSVLVILTPQVMTEVKKTAEITTDLSHQYPDKTVLGVFIGGESIHGGDAVFRRNRFPNFGFPARAAETLDKMHKYSVWKSSQKKHPKSHKDLKKKHTSKKLDSIFSKLSPGNRLSVTEVELLTNAYEINAPVIRLATTQKEALSFAKKAGFPVVMKIASPQIYHKTDAGGLRIDIQDEISVKNAWDDILASVKKYNPKAKIDGITVEPMVPIGKEIIIGAKKDPQFGHMIMFGLGGIYVEILKDVTFRIAPVSQDEAVKMIEEIKTIELLRGARGEKPVDIKAIAKVIESVGRIVTDYPQIQEFEINPLIACPSRGTFAVDVNCIV
jgi:acetyl coenzyme A synthetase (ADP forming)-like protein